ncbi:hypothetical protein Tco_0465142, partial [Tanacetum coccineum]
VNEHEIFVMSFQHLQSTYTSVYTDSEPGRVPFRSIHPSPTNVPDLESTTISPTNVPVPSDDEAPWEDQPLPADASPVALSPGYVADSDPEEDPEEDHADYPADGGDDDDEPSDDDDDDTDDKDEEPIKDEDDDEEGDHADYLIYLLLTLFPQLGIQRHLRLMRLHLHLYHHLNSTRLGCPSDPIPSPPLPPPPSSLHLPPHVPTSLPLPSSPLPNLIFLPPTPVDLRDIPEDGVTTLPTRGYQSGLSVIRHYGCRDQTSEKPRRTDRLSYHKELTYWSRIDSFTRDLHSVGSEALDSYLDARLPYRLTGVTDDDIDCTSFITTGTVVSSIGTDSGTLG